MKSVKIIVNGQHMSTMKYNDKETLAYIKKTWTDMHGANVKFV